MFSGYVAAANVLLNVRHRKMTFLAVVESNEKALLKLEHTLGPDNEFHGPAVIGKAAGPLQPRLRLRCCISGLALCQAFGRAHSFRSHRRSGKLNLACLAHDAGARTLARNGVGSWRLVFNLPLVWSECHCVYRSRVTVENAKVPVHRPKGNALTLQKPPPGEFDLGLSIKNPPLDGLLNDRLVDVVCFLVALGRDDDGILNRLRALGDHVPVSNRNLRRGRFSRSVDADSVVRLVPTECRLQSGFLGAVPNEGTDEVLVDSLL